MLFKLRYHQCVSLLFCVLVLSQQVVGKSETAERKRYESAFENLFRQGKAAINQLSGFHKVVENNKELHQTMTKIKNFVKTNPDKVGLGIGLAASSWLLYQSVILANKTQRFFDEIEELKGQFNKYYLQEVPKLEDLFRKTRDQLYENDQEKRKEHFRTIYKHLMKYFQDLQRIMDNVNDIISDVNKARVDGVISTVASGAVAVLAGVAMVMEVPIKVPPEVWKAGLSVTIGMSSASTALSLKNTQDLKKAENKLNVLNGELRKLRNQVMEKMTEIFQFL